MLPQKNRLLKKEDFQKTWKGGGSFYTKNLGFKLNKNKTGNFRLGVVIGNKISKLATERNRIKRIIREIIRLNLDKLTPGHDLVIIALPNVKGKKHEQLEKDLFLALNKFKILKK